MLRVAADSLQLIHITCRHTYTRTYMYIYIYICHMYIYIYLYLYIHEYIHTYIIPKKPRRRQVKSLRKTDMRWLHVFLKSGQVAMQRIMSTPHLSCTALSWTLRAGAGHRPNQEAPVTVSFSTDVNFLLHRAAKATIQNAAIQTPLSPHRIVPLMM